MSLLFKVIYTVLLLGITSVAIRELWFVWLDKRVYIGRFDVITGLGKDDAESDAFAKRIVAQQSILVQQLTDYGTRRDALSDTTYRVDGIAPLQLPPEVMGGIDITVQEINVRQVLTAVRRAFLAPNEITGSVTQQESSVMALVNWPGAPDIAGDNGAIARFLTPNRGNAQAVAAHIACSITWARASSEGTGPFAQAGSWINGRLAKATQEPQGLAKLSPRAQFCDFMAALGDLYALEEMASSVDGLGDPQTNTVRRHAAVLRSHYADKTVLPDIYRLRADLLDLLPEEKRVPGELVDAQEDRLRYAMLSPTLRTLPEEERRIAALALARPAIRLEDGKPHDVPPNWTSLLVRRSADIAAISAATGMVVDADGKHVATGFIVAPGLMVTTRHVLDPMIGKDGEEPPAGVLKLCMGFADDRCADSLAMEKIVYDGSSDGSNVALVELRAHDPALIVPVPIADTAIEPNTVIGRYAYVVGYPAIDFRMPAEFNVRLLQNVGGVKRVMPGRILAFGGRSIFTSDISTTAGTGGGPFVDLLTGKVIGMSYAGMWQQKRGKFAYSESIPAAALETIRKRVGGEATQEQ